MIVVGSGKVFELVKNGDVDVMLVYVCGVEDKFVVDGYGVDWCDVMYNDFVVVGFVGDFVGIKGGKDVVVVFVKIVVNGVWFIVCGDNLGMDVMEKSYW